jgi:tryptophan 2,3-dioxygenase
MQPAAYLVIRQGLGTGSGLDSPGFNRINEVAPKAYATFENCLQRRNCDLLAMYEDPSRHPQELAVAEALVTFDANMQRFKYEHLFVVRRIIGNGTASLRGNPVEMLERSAKLCYYPLLWAARERLFADFKIQYPSG